MRRIMLLAGLCIAAAGCGAVDPAAGRATLADARAACVGVGWLTTIEFEAVVDLARLAREDDVEAGELLGGFAEGCQVNFFCNGFPPCITTCTLCFVEVVAAVYDE